MDPARLALVDGDESGALAILNEIVHVQREYMREGDPQRMWDELLHSLMRTTSSRGGFIGEIEWNSTGIPDLNTRAMVWNGGGGPQVTPHPDIGLLVSQIIAEQAPVIVNLNGSARPGGGLIDGFLGIPLISSDRIVGVVGLTSSDAPYARHWVDRVQPLLSACASIIESLQAASERQRLVMELERTASFLQAVINGSTHGALVIDPVGNIETANPAAHALLDSPTGELVGRPITEFVDPRDMRSHVALMRRALRHGVPSGTPPFITTVIAASGKARSVEASIGEMVLDAERRLVVMLHDISERLQAQSALARAAEVIEATPDLIAWTDPQGRLVYLNRGGRQMLGIDMDHEVDDLTIDSFCTIDATHPLIEQAMPAARANGVWRGELTFQRLDGGAVPVSVVVIATEEYTAVQARDLTERLEIDQLKEAVVSNVSHELRTPLTAVIGYLELLADGVLGELTPDQSEVVEIMTRNGDRLLDLIGDILLIGSMDAGCAVPRRRVDLAEVVSDVVAGLDAIREKRGVAVETDFDGACLVAGDEGELKTVVANLVGNALKFTEPGGRVAVSIEPSEAEVTLTVSDTGIGIAQDELSNVFDRFYRGGHARRSEIQGAGLGLAIVNGVVQRHGGRVDITSTVGVGTTVTVVLPSAEKGAE